MSFINTLRSGINNIQNANPAAALNQFNQGLTRNVSQLTDGLSSAGGLLQQAEGLSSRATSALSSINLSEAANLSPIFSDFEQTFQGTIENLSRANVIGSASNLTGSISDITNNLNGGISQVSNLFQQNRITQSLNGISQNISVLPESFSAVTGRVSDIAGAVNNLSSTATGILNSARDIFNPLSNYDDAILRQLRLTTSRGASVEQTPSESGTGVRIKNPLRDYASYNYNLELACLSPYEINSPEDTYRINLSNSIVRSGGGNLQQRVTTFNEDTFGKHAEYYIDDLEVDTVISPNPNTGVTQGTNIKFKITEPYSMGQFLESLQIAATQAGYANYIEAPYVLKISFFGINTDGQILNNLASPPKFIPLKLTNIEFEVRGEGSMYEVEAIPYNEMALTAQTAVVRTDVNIAGGTVAQALETGNPNNPGQYPLTDILNGRAQSVADAAAYDSPDRYIIMFPPDLQGATRAVSAAREADTGRNTGATSTITETQASQIGGALSNILRAQGTQVIPDGAVYDVLRRYARENINEIGRSAIIEDVNQDGDRTPSPHADVIDPDTGTVNRAAAGAQMDETTRNGLYTQGTSIISIIENMVITSEWGRRLAEEKGQEGLREWFRIESQVFLETDPGAELTRGTPPKIYVYSVVRYYPDEAKVLAPTQRPENTQGLMELACKEYNYYYTGLNEDVLNFNIEFKTAFFQNLFADLGQHSSGLRTGRTGETVDGGELNFTEMAPPGIGPVSNGQLSEPGAPIEEVINSTDHANGGIRMSATTASKYHIAQAFHDSLINSDVDLINAEMEIWGDPYFLPTNGMGNYNGPSGGRPGLAADGVMDYQNSEVFVVVNFRTPFDYNVRTGMMQFSNVVKPFSGLYSVTSVRNEFSGGKFTNNLKMIRRRGQNDEPTGDPETIRLGNNQIIGPTNRANNGEATGAGTAGQPNNSGVTSVPGAGGGGGGGGGGGVGVDPATPTGTNGEPVPTSGGGSLSTIRTSKRGIETQVASIVAQDMQGFIDELENDFGYEITQFGGYVDRYIAGTTTKSWHASGIAIDINWATNPDNRNRRLITDLPQPPNGSEMTALAAKYGLGWGGDWSGNYIDPMHFSAASNERGTLIVQRGVIPAERIRG